MLNEKENGLKATYFDKLYMNEVKEIYKSRANYKLPLTSLWSFSLEIRFGNISRPSIRPI